MRKAISLSIFVLIATVGLAILIRTVNPSYHSYTIVGDINGDGVVDSGDLGILGIAWGSHSGDSNYVPAADLNSDGNINAFDFALLSMHWGQRG